MLQAFVYEMEERKNYIGKEKIETIYFGGGTPSLLDTVDIESLLHEIHDRFDVMPQAEITLEANPDDLTIEKLKALRSTGINRFSIGIQSFFDEHLLFMNRSHNANQAKECIQNARNAGFENMSMDLIFGYPQLSDEQWKENMEIAIESGVTHISCYGMTVEPRTALEWQIRKNKIPDISSDQSAQQYEALMETLGKAGFEHYEISNFAKPGHRAIHNSNYWNGKKYLGIGPSAHSFNGETRQWNVANNVQYIHGVQTGKQIQEIEFLTREQKINESILIQLRRMEGLNADHLRTTMTPDELDRFDVETKEFVRKDWIRICDEHIQLTQKGKLYADYLAGRFFLDTNE